MQNPSHIIQVTENDIGKTLQPLKIFKWQYLQDASVDLNEKCEVSVDLNEKCKLTNLNSLT